MNPKVFHTLEFDKVITRLMEHASTERGKSYCQKLTPITNLDKITARQVETDDALKRIYRNGSISFGGVHDVTPFQKRLEIGGSLNAGELLEIASLLSAAGAASRYGDTGSNTEARDSLSSYFEGLAPVQPLHDEIHRCILSEDSIADDASSELKSIRRSLAGLDERVRSEMNRMLTGSAHDYLQDAVVTIRDNRYCLPVKAEYKSQISGIVHDQSSTGQTLFIEPMAVVNLNNERKELELREHKEIDRILAQLSANAYEHMSEIDNDFRILSELDFIFAKGKLAEEMQGISPVFNEDGQIDLKEARHPLLDPSRVVPINVNLGIHFNQLIVTGPNTGGKTVSLKTIGLLTLMGQAGLHIPAAAGSRLSVFHNVYADIGDEQSIEQSLSTFSSHMVNIISILRSVEQSPNTALCLFDELCAGTDPAEGAALATAILSQLHTEGVKTMATTHYSELKEYALSTNGVENAACEFSLETLSPTYRLLIGVPGKSNAFAISRKLGLTSDIIEDARNRMTEHAQSFEDLLTDLEEKRIRMEKQEASFQSDKEALDRRIEKLRADEARLANEKTRMIQDASQEAARILKQAKDEADETIRKFRKMKADSPDMRKMEQERTALNKKLSQAQEKSSASTMTKHIQSTNSGAINIKNIHVGDNVRVLSMNMNGTIHTLPNSKGELEVQMGIIRSKVHMSDIQLLGEESTSERFRREMKEKRRKQAGVSGTTSLSSFGKAATISPEIKLLGLTRDEAIAKLDKYIDDAYLSHLKEVRIVHGKGTGALRKAVQGYLDGNMYVKEYHQAAYGEGDAGVTIARLG